MLVESRDLGEPPLEYCYNAWCGKTRMVWLRGGEKKIRRHVFSQPSIDIDGWLYGMSMTSVVCKNVESF